MLPCLSKRFLTDLFTQIVCSLIALGCSGASTPWGYYECFESGIVLALSAAWMSAGSVVIGALSLFFAKRPLEIWPLPLILDGLGIMCGIGGTIVRNKMNLGLYILGS